MLARAGLPKGTVFCARPGSTGLSRGYKLRLAVVIVARDTFVSKAPRRLPLQVVLLAPTLLWAVVSLVIAFRVQPAKWMLILMQQRIALLVQPGNIAAAAQQAVRIVLPVNGIMIRMQQQRVRIVIPVNIAAARPPQLVRIVLLAPTLLQVVVSLAIAFRV